jgi:hypothetical protein
VRAIAIVALGTALASAGCGGGRHAATAPVDETGAPTAVTDQLRAALQQAIEAGPVGGVSSRPAALRMHVTGCSGPRLRLAGTYRCTVTPLHEHRTRTLVVTVDRAGTWQTTIPADLARARAAVVGLWGAGLHL